MSRLGWWGACVYKPPLAAAYLLELIVHDSENEAGHDRHSGRTPAFGDQRPIQNSRLVCCDLSYSKDLVHRRGNLDLSLDGHDRNDGHGRKQRPPIQQLPAKKEENRRASPTRHWPQTSAIAAQEGLASM